MILCCGEAVIDMLPTKVSGDADGFYPVAGGAAVNSAIALARLGQTVGFFGGLSSDTFGHQLRNAMTSEGVDTSAAKISDAPSTLAFVHPTAEGQAFTFMDENSAARQVDVMSLPALEDVHTLIFGGISLITAPAAGAFEALLQAAGETRLTLLDPNIRPALIGDEAPYRERLRRMMAMADIIKLSDEDLAWLGGFPPQSLLMGRAALVLHTHGAKGATVWSRHGALPVEAAQVDVIDTVGAGDTFNAGFLASLAQQGLLHPARIALANSAQIERAAVFASKVAALSVKKSGANPPYLKDIV